MIIEMFTGKAPWSEYEGAAAMFKVMKDTPPVPETLSPEGKDFLGCCFRRNPAERPTASMLLELQFVKCSPLSGASSSNGLKSTKSLRSSKAATPERETTQRSHYQSPELRVTARNSPRSTLETLPSLSPPSSGQSAHHPGDQEDPYFQMTNAERKTEQCTLHIRGFP